MVLNRPLFLEATGGDTPFAFSAQEARTLVDALVIGAGVSWKNDLQVVQRAAGANFSVDVAAGHCIILGTSVADQGKYVCQNTATLNVTLTGAPASGTRFDLIYAQVRDKQADGGSAYDFVIDKVTGTVGAGLPATPANAIALAQIGPVISSTPSITTSLITSLRTVAWPLGAARGKIGFSGLVVASQTGITTEATLTNMAATVTIPVTGRLIRIWCSARIDTATVAGRWLLRIKEGGTTLNIGRSTAAASATNSPIRHEFSALVSSPSVGSHTYTVSLEQANGTTVDFVGSATEPGFVLVEDLGDT